MKNINEFGSRDEWMNYAWTEFLESIQNKIMSSILDSLLSQYEKKIIINRIMALSLIRKGKTYRQIGEELWLSPNTIRSLKMISENRSVKEYQGDRFRRNKKEKTASRDKKPEYFPEPSPFFDWIDHFASSLPEKHGRRWSKFTK